MKFTNNKQSTGWVFVMSILIVMVILQLVNTNTLRYQNNWFLEGEFWRVISGHLVHINWKHLLINSLGLILCMIITAPQWSIKQWLCYNMILACGISVILTIENTGLQWYVGYSGILSGIYVLAVLDLYKREKMIALIIGVAICIKILLEQTSSMTITSGDFIGAPVIVDSHLYGVLLALLVARIQQLYFSKSTVSKIPIS